MGEQVSLVTHHFPSRHSQDQLDRTGKLRTRIRENRFRRGIKKKKLHVTVSDKITRLLFIDPISLILADTFPSENTKRKKGGKKKEEKKMQRHVIAFFCETDRRRCAYDEIEKNRKTCISGEIARIARFLFLLRLT